MDLRDQLQHTLGTTYTVERELGGGGMSRVFVARDTALKREVVIKVLAPELAGGVSGERFGREIELAAQLQHPNIVPLLSAGETDGLPFYSMPFVAGESLRARINRGGELPIRDAVSILRDVARALAYAHTRGVVHRDIKPDNVLLAHDYAVVTDFGVGKALSAARAVSGGGDRSTLTQLGTALGTPAYMAPEQAAGDPATDHRADIYAFGAMAYETLAGAPPFAARGAQSLFAAHAAERPTPIVERRPLVPPALGALVMRCLEKRPADRPQSADEIVQALDSVATSFSGSSAVGLAADAPRGRSRALRWGAAIVVLVAIAFGGYAVAHRRTGAQHPSSSVIAVLPFRVTSADPNVRTLREGMLDLVAAKLTGTIRTADTRTVLTAWRHAGGSETADIDEKAALSSMRAIGAGRVLQGEILQTGAALQIHGTLIDVSAPDRRVSATVSGAPTAIAALVDTLAAKLLALSAGEGEQNAATLASIPLPALEAYLQGQRAYRRGLYQAAANSFAKALEYDSTFALAGLQLLEASSWTTDARGDFGERVARRYANQLSPIQRLILGPDGLTGCADRHESNEKAVQIAPDVPELWYAFADELFHCGWAMGIPDAWPRALAGFQRALALDSAFTPALEHVAMIQARLGDTAAAMKSLARYADTSDFLPFNRLFIITEPNAHAAALRDFATGDLGFVAQVAVVSLGSAERPSIAESEYLLRAVAKRAATDADRRQLAMATHGVALERGQPRRALAAAEAMGAHPSDLVLDAIFWDGDTAAAVRALPAVRHALDTPLPSDSAEQQEWVTSAFAAGEYDIARLQSASARRAATLLRAVPASSPWAASRAHRFALLLDAQIATLSKENDAPALVARADSMLRRVDGGLYNQDAGNLIVSRLWEQLGDTRRAYAAVQRRRSGPGMNRFGATYLREEARLAAAAGDVNAAIHIYRRYVTVRAEPEPSMLPDLEAAKRELARLEKAAGGK